MNFGLILYDTLSKLKDTVNQFKNPIIAYSGGADSDVVLKLSQLLDLEIPLIFYDTGIEWQATLNHLPSNISELKSDVPVPLAVKKYGQPFISKRVSDYLSRLQKHNFDFKKHGNLEFKELYKLYPNCKAALRWWCNDFGKNSSFNIERNKLLKEFLIDYGLPFNVSNKCCTTTKKLPIKTYAKENNIDLVLTGLRKSEGGSRVGAYKSYFSYSTSDGYTMYRPVWFWKNDIKEWFIQRYDIKLSNCYTKYGLDRTGCAGCPYGRKFEHELNQLHTNEPRLAKGIENIFSKSYEWTRKYNQYKDNK